MKIFFLALVGLFLGAIVGGVIGVGLGFAWTKVFQTTSFEDNPACWCSSPSCRLESSSAGWPGLSALASSPRA